MLKEGSLAADFATELWTLPRIAQLIEQRFSVSMVPSSVWRLLGRLGWSVQRPTGQAESATSGDQDVEGQEVARTKKKSLRDKGE